MDGAGCYSWRLAWREMKCGIGRITMRMWYSTVVATDERVEHAIRTATTSRQAGGREVMRALAGARAGGLLRRRKRRTAARLSGGGRTARVHGAPARARTGACAGWASASACGMARRGCTTSARVAGACARTRRTAARQGSAAA
jgi:hypothetical protein